MYLNAHSWFSFKYGVMKPYALLEEAAKAGVRSFALTDIHCTAGIPDFVRDAMRYFNIRPVAGIEFRAGARLLYIGLAKNNNGFQRLNELLSPHLLDDEVLPERAPELEDVFFIYPMQNAPQRLRPNERVGIRPWELTRLPFSPFHNGVRCRPQDLVALLPVTLRNKVDHNVHRLLRTVAKNTVLSMLPPEELAQPDEVFRSEAEVRHLYRDFPQLLENAQRLLDACDIAFDGSDKTWKVLGASAAEDRAKLHRDTLEGMAYRYPKASAKVKARVQHELKVIEDMGFISYFLINQDIVDHARRRGFFHVGRGSGANSVVAYCLRITDVDPMELDLYFERFINPARKKPPDFDIDFSWKDRDEIFRHVFGKYNGQGASGIHAAQIATYTTFQWRGAVRELGKAMGLPPAEIDALSEGDSGYFSRGKPSADVRNGELDRVARAVVRYGKELLGMPHHLGIHAGGVVITDQPVTHFTALYRPPKGFPVTQFSMLEAEDLGLHKFDLLSQRGLGHIRDAVELVNKTQDTRHKFQGSNTKDVQLDVCDLRHETCDFREAAVGLVNKTQDTRHKFQGSNTKDVQLDVCDLRHETCDFREAAVGLVNKTQDTRHKFQGSSTEDVQLDACDLRHETCDFREAAVELVNKTQDTRHKFQGSSIEDVQLDACDLRHETCDFREAAVELVNKTQDTRHKFQGSSTEDVQLDACDLRHETCDFREAAVELVNKTQDTRHKFQGSSTEDVQLDACDLRHETCDFREAAVELVNKTQDTRHKFQGSSTEDVQLDACDLRHETCDFREAAVELVNKTQDTRHKFQGSSIEDVQLDACDLRHETCDFREAAVDIHDIQRFKQDPAIKELIRRGDTIGCFYVESPAMRMLLKKLEVDDYLGLVAASSIIRPGVAESGMMREYLLRHRDPERRKLAPERMMAIMPETYGVMVYQEDVMRVVVQYAGLTAEEADQVRRGMNIRYRDRPEFKVVERKFFDNCRERGYPNGEAEEVWRQIQSFASFSFAKGHSASYAVESYQSLYLKAHHPLEFLVGVVNNFGGFYHTEFYLHEAKRAGAVIEAPCVNRSEELCTLQKGVGPQQGYVPHAAHNGGSAPRIFLGLGNVKSLNEASVALILNERRKNGPYTDLEDLLKRVPLGLEQARILVRVGALRCTGRSKPQLLWDVALLHRPATVRTTGDLFITKVEEPRLPDLQHYALADAYDELDLLGFPLCDPFELVDLSEPTAHDQPPTILKRDMAAHVGKRVRMLGYMIHVKATDTHHGQRMTFGSFIDPAGDFWDSTQFPDVAAQYTFRGRGVYRFIGVVEEEFGHTSLRTERLEKLPWRPDPRYGDG